MNIKKGCSSLHANLTLMLALLAVALTGCAGLTPAGNPIELSLEGDVVNVPQSGPLQNSTATAVAVSTLKVDEILDNPLLIENETPREVRQAGLEMAFAFRNEAVDALHQTYVLAENTSGGLDDALLNTSKENIDIAMQIIAELRESKPDRRLNVRTEITSRPESVLEYVSFGRNRDVRGDWSTYNFGEVMRIGRYRFRAIGTTRQTGIIDEVIHVLSDPTIRNIASRPR